ncbi:MAG: histone deacetylase [Hormoscilla sp. SP12CHS1]|nr:histone deacetylase [Hormoscilla sp. SP12CHS1]
MIRVIYSDEFLLHDNGWGHPEKPERLTAIVNALKAAPWAEQIEWQLPPTPEERSMLPLMQQVHPEKYIEAVRNLANRGGGHIDGDTPVSPRSYEVAMLAVSAWRDGIDRLLATGNPAFVLARPPGHHALSDRGMGFCIFSNAAIAAHYALEQSGVNRVAILDWDVHHGNGTQAIVESNPQIAYCSLHQFPFYPGTGAARERGFHNNVLNIPMARGSTLAEYQPMFEQKVMPFLTDFGADILGYDANYDDPLAEICLQPQDYGVFTDYCLRLTHRILFGLEGGYDFESLSKSVMATIASCLTANTNFLKLRSRKNLSSRSQVPTWERSSEAGAS